FMRKVLKAFTLVFVQNEDSQQLLNEINITSKVCGDTRYDRVLMNAQNVKTYPEIEQFTKGHKVLVCGSIWPEDLEVIKQTIAKSTETKVIIAPHEINNSFIGQIEQAVKRKTVRYSTLSQKPSNDADIMIIDNIGMLMNLYQYGQLAYVGGGFKTGLHNIDRKST